MARPKVERTHSAALRIRLLPEQDALIREAARHAGISLSDWLRDRLMKAARTELHGGVGESKTSA